MIYVVNELPHAWKTIAKIVLFLTITISSMFTLRYVAIGTVWMEASLFFLFAGCAVILVVNYLQQSPFTMIESRLTSAQIQSWVEFGERSGETPTSAMKAINSHRRAMKMAADKEALKQTATQTAVLREELSHVSTLQPLREARAKAII